MAASNPQAEGSRAAAAQRGVPPDEGARVVRSVTAWGMAVNLVLTALKFAAGIVGHSHAIVADAVHSLSDTATDIAVLAGAGFWSKPADEEHPYGHKRIETAVAFGVGAVLMLAGFKLARDAALTLRGHGGPPPGWIGFWAAVLSIVVKEWLYRWTYGVGTKLRSVAMKANAWHHRSDALSSIVTAVAVGGAVLLPGWTLLDLIGAIVVAVFIMQAAWRIMWPGVRELIDSGAPRQARNRILQLAAATPGVRRVHALRTRYVASDLQVDLHVLVDGNLTVREGHNIAEQVGRRVRESGPDVIDVVVHIEPDDHEGH